MRWYGVRHHAGVVDQHVDRAERRRPRRPRGGPTPRSARSTTSCSSSASGTSRADRRRRSRRAARAVRPASTTRAPRRASSSAVWWPRPPSVVPVTTTVRPAWSGMSASRQASASGSRSRGHRDASRGSARRAPGRRRRATAPGLGRAPAAGEHGRTPRGPCAAAPSGRPGPPAAARRGRSSVDGERAPAAALHLEHRGGAGRRADPLGRARSPRLSARYAAVCRAAGRVQAAGAADRAADVLLVHPHVQRPVAQQRLPVPARRRRRSAPGSPTPSVGGSASRAVCRAVADSRISLMISSGVRSRRATTPDSV